jgi:hypothetical protein
MRNVNKLLAASVAAIFLASSALASQEFSNVEASNASPMFDVLVMRPVGLIGLAFGAVLFVPAAAMTLAIQPTEIGKPTEALIKKPFRYVFSDPIGSH